MSDGTPEPDGVRELREVVKEFLHHLDAASQFRLQNLLFYAEVWCLQTYGKRLTNAEFVPDDRGSFSRGVERALAELRGSGEVEFTGEHGPDDHRGEYRYHGDGGDLSLARNQIVEHVCEETANWSPEQLEAFSKGTWLYENTPTGERMDFETYRDEVIVPRPERERIADRVDAPVEGGRPVDEFVRQ